MDDTAPKPRYSNRGLRNSKFEILWEAKHQHDRHLGLGWTDMPGITPDTQKLNWFLFKRGRLYDPRLFARMGKRNQDKYQQFIQRAAAIHQSFSIPVSF